MSFKSWSSGIKNPSKYKSDDKPGDKPAVASSVAHPLPPPDKAPSAGEPVDKA